MTLIDVQLFKAIQGHVSNLFSMAAVNLLNY